MPRAVDGLKQCCRCKETKPISEYYKNKAKFDGLQQACRVCNKQYSEQNREHKSEYQKQYSKQVLKTDPYVYKVIVTHEETEYFYYGKTTRILKWRLSNHLSHRNSSLGQFINEHNLAREDLKIEQYPCPSLEEATVLERKLIAANIDNPLCLNKRPW